MSHQYYLVSGSETALNDIRDTFLTHPEICIPHKENGYWYGAVTTDVSGSEYLLCVLDTAVQYLTTEQSNSLVHNLPANFITDDLI
jgi:hypothetical protein